MAKRNRNTLKRYFEKGRLPSADQFGDLIDSTLNPIDDGFDKTRKNGFEVSLADGSSRLISFFKSGATEVGAQDNVVWAIEYDRINDALLLRQPDSDPAVTYRKDRKIPMREENSSYTLDVNGVIAAAGRIGANPYDQKTVLADGQWHSIAGPLTGCHAVEVIAGVGQKASGKYALLRAIAMNTFNPRGWLFNFLNLKKRIKCQHAYYLSRGNRIKLRWTGKGNQYYLQMRTACGYGKGIRIRYYLTWLWFDELMRESWEQADKGVE